MAGRKVYRKSIGTRKKRRKTSFYALLTILGLSVLIFLGYSVAEPIGRFLRERKEGGAVTEPWVRPSLPDEITADNDAVDDGDQENSENQQKKQFSFSACKIPVSAMESYCSVMDSVFGGGSVTVLQIRPVGAEELAV